MFTKKKRLFSLIFVFALLSLIYWTLGNTSLAIPVVFTYGVLCLSLSVLYVLVNGGIQPILDDDRKREKKSRDKYLADKGKLHPIKRKDKYRRFRVKGNGEMVEKKAEEPTQPRPNPLKLSEEKRVLYSQILLVMVIPFYLIFLLDWLYVTIFG